MSKQYINIPIEAASDPNLRGKISLLLYSYIWGLAQKDETCLLSRQQLADMLGTTAGNIRQEIYDLRKINYIMNVETEQGRGITINPNSHIVQKPTETPDIKKKRAAWSQVNKALKDGRIQKPTRCSQCGRTTTVFAHHYNYDQPLNVVWLCGSCHQKLHRGGTGTKKKAEDDIIKRLTVTHIDGKLKYDMFDEFGELATLFVPVEIMQDKRLTQIDKYVLSYIYSFDGGCYATTRRISENLNINPQTARNSLSKLYQLGLATSEMVDSDGSVRRKLIATF